MYLMLSLHVQLFRDLLNSNWKHVFVSLSMTLCLLLLSFPRSSSAVYLNLATWRMRITCLPCAKTLLGLVKNRCVKKDYVLCMGVCILKVKSRAPFRSLQGQSVQVSFSYGI